MKKLGFTIGCLLVMAGLTFGQQASFSLTDSTGAPTAGTYNPGDVFTLSLTGTATGFNADGFSLWLEVPTLNGFNTAISITTGTMFQFPDRTQPIYPKVFTGAQGADAGFLTDIQGALSGDLGATSSDPSQDFTGSAHLADYTFTLNNAPAGTYLLKSTVLSPKFSEINDDGFASHNAAQIVYTITIVPEPATWSLIGLGGLGAFGLTWLRARRK